MNSRKGIDMENKKEITGIYNTTFNEKSATPIKTGFETDIEVIENAIIEEVAMYVRGFHNIKRDKGFGAEHIKLHLEKDSKGYISIEELLNLGKSIREYLKIFKESFIDVEGNKQAKIYEWENNKGVRFRAVVDKIRRESDNCRSISFDDIKREGLPKTPLSPSDNVIISFYSDTQAQSLDGRLVQKNISSTEKIIPQNPKPQELKNTLKPQIKPKYKEEEDGIISSKTFKKRR